MKTTKRRVKSNSKKLVVSALAPEKNDCKYEQDFCKWTQSQANLLRQGKLEKLDVDNLIEEIESLGRSDERSLKSHCIVLLQHLLKTHYQPNKRTSSWNNSIRNARLEIELILEDSPSLKKELNKTIESAYSYAKQKAMIETRLDESKFPQECPWGLQEILPTLLRK